MSVLRAAVLGLGVGQRHALGYAAHPGCELAAVCDFDPEKLAWAAERWPGVRRTASAEEVLDDPEIDVVSICTYDHFHHRQVVRALEAGKHVFVEKPLCVREQEAAQIRAALAARPGLRLSSNLVLRLCPRFQQLRRRIAGGALGRLYYLEGDYDYGRIHKITEGWRGTSPGFSVVFGGAVHLVDLLLWLSGERVAEVAAFGNGLATEGTRLRNFDLVAALLRFDSGLVAKVTANFACVHPHFHHVAVYGTEGTFRNGLAEGTYWERGGTGAHPPPVGRREPAPYPGVAKEALLASFLDAIRDGGEPPVTAEEVFESMAVCFAIERAAHEGGPVEVRRA